MHVRNKRYAAALAVLLSGAAIGASTVAAAGPRLGAWTTPAPVDGGAVAGGCPIESRDGRTLYVAGGFDGTLDVFKYERADTKSAFGPREKVTAPVSLDDANDFCPTPLPGGYLLFVSNRALPDACGGTDMYVVRYNRDTGELLEGPRNLGCAPNGPNTSGGELSPSYVTTKDGIQLYFSTDVAGTQDLYVSEGDFAGNFSAASAVAELNTEADDRQPNVGRGGLEIVFASNRDGVGAQDIFTATRSSLSQPWGNIRNLSFDVGFPTAGGSETRPSLSWDLQRLYYGSGGTVYLSRRTPCRVWAASLGRYLDICRASR